MTLSYTPIEASVFAAPSAGAWVEYDLYTNKSVPKGAVAEIVIRNSYTDDEQIGGVKEKGSGLERKIDIHEAEGGGYTTAEMLVQTDATDGKIEVYSENTTYVDFVLMGYFEGCDFTEKFVDIEYGSGVWLDKDLAPFGVPANAVCQMLMVNTRNVYNRRMGVRENDSSFDRRTFLDEAEEGGGNAHSMLVKADSSSIIECSSSDLLNPFYILGWFNAVVDFTEGWTWYESPSKEDGEWVSRTITEAPASAIIAFSLVHQDSGNETYCGLREEGSSQERKIQEHEQEGGHGGGFQACVTLDASKKCEVFCTDSSESLFYYTGYFSEGIATYERTVLLDALLQKTGLTKSVDLDVALQTAGITRSVDLDVAIQKIIQKSVDLDTVLKAVGEELSVDLDTLLKAVGIERTVLLDLLIKLRAQKSLDLDVVLQAIYERTVDLDLLIKAEEVQRTVDLDVLIKLRAQRTVLLDMITKALGVQLSVDLDVALQKLGIEKSVDIDVLLQALEITRTVDLDVALQKLAIARSVDLDLVLQARYERSVDLDTVLKALNVTRTVDLDVVIQTAGITKTVDLDTILKKTGIPRTVLLDILLQEAGVTTYERTVLLDLLIMALEVTRTVDLDVALQKLGVERTVLLDVLIQILGITKSVDLDVVLQTAGITKSVDLDLLIKAEGIQRTVDLDTLLKLRTQKTVDLDVLLQNAGIEKSVDLDLLIKAEGIERSVDLDVLLKLRAQRTVLMDLITKAMGVTRSVDMDVALQKTGITRTFILDVVLSEEAVEEVIRLPIEGVIPRRRRRRPRPRPERGELIREIAVTIYEELTKSWPAVIRIWEINNFSAELLQVIYTMDSFELQAFDQTIYETENLEAEIIPFHAHHLLEEVEGLREALSEAGVDKASLEGLVTKLEKAVKMYELRRELTAD